MPIGKYNSSFNSSKYSTSIDAGLGLVYRLNNLWRAADFKSLNGDFDGWNFNLDRIYCNLSYRESMKKEYDPETKQLVSVKIDEENAKIYHLFKKRIRLIKAIYSKAIQKKNFVIAGQAREMHYQILMEKDMWLRKFMSELGLYLKEYEYNPATALFGGG